MKKIAITICSIGFLFLVFSVDARVTTDSQTNNMLRETIQNKTRQNVQKRISTGPGELKIRMSVLSRGKLTAISGNTLTLLDKEGATLTVHVLESTHLRRRFGGIATLSEFMIGDELMVVGKQVEKNEYNAVIIRNLSIQRRNVVFVGEITEKLESSFVFQTIKRNKQTAIVDSSTTITEKDKKITIADLTVGDKVLVKGELWDRANSKINAKRILKLQTGRNVIGGQKDEHGCLIPGGYSWCEKKQKCLRSWEESC